MENNEKNVVIEAEEVKTTDVTKVEKKPNLVVRAGKWLWARKGYVLTSIVSFGLGAVAVSAKNRGEDDEIETDYEASDNGIDEGPTED